VCLLLYLPSARWFGASLEQICQYLGTLPSAEETDETMIQCSRMMKEAGMDAEHIVNYLNIMPKTETDRYLVCVCVCVCANVCAQTCRLTSPLDLFRLLVFHCRWKETFTVMTPP
jgi:hypothetical protein